MVICVEYSFTIPGRLDGLNDYTGLLWNMPYKLSSFLQVVSKRQEKPDNNTSAEYRKALRKTQQIYALDQPEEKKEYTEEEKTAIDDYDRMMAEIRGRK